MSADVRSVPPVRIPAAAAPLARLPRTGEPGPEEPNPQPLSGFGSGSEGKDGRKRRKSAKKQPDEREAPGDQPEQRLLKGTQATAAFEAFPHFKCQFNLNATSSSPEVSGFLPGNQKISDFSLSAF